MNTDRLFRLAHLLENIEIPQETVFDLTYWGQRAEYVERSDIPEACNTVVCACGYAALTPEFQSEGLFAFHDADKKIPDIATFNKLAKKDSNFEMGIQFEGKESWDAINKFFEIDQNQASYLFSSSSYFNNPSPADVAIRIRLFVDSDGTVLEEYVE